MADEFRVADQFSGLDMASLIGGPLKAACDAQSMMANATADFIERIGLEEKREGDKGPRKLRTTTFSFTRTAPGTAGPDGKVTDTLEEVTMKVPFLSIVNVPSLAISDVNVTFDMEVKSSTSAEATSSKSGSLDVDAKLKFGFFGSVDVKIKGSVSSSEKNTRSTDNSAKYHVDVKAKDKGLPEGLSRMLDILSTACAPSKVEPKPAPVE